MIKEIQKIITFSVTLLFTSCSVWQDEFDEPVPRAIPKASIHKISTMVDKGIIKESDVNDLTVFESGSSNYKVFKDGTVSRGSEDVRRVYLLSYEDSDKTFHAAHYLYAVVRPAAWVVAPQAIDGVRHSGGVWNN